MVRQEGVSALRKVASGKFLANEREQSMIAVRLRQEANLGSNPIYLRY